MKIKIEITNSSLLMAYCFIFCALFVELAVGGYPWLYIMAGKFTLGLACFECEINRYRDHLSKKL